MLGFLKKLSRNSKNSTSQHDADQSLGEADDSSNVSWAEHEISDEIVEKVESLETLNTQQAPSVAPEVSLAREQEIIADKTDVTDTYTTPSTKRSNPDLDQALTAVKAEIVEIAALDSADLNAAIDFVIAPLDPMDEITEKIKEEMAEAERVKLARQKRRRLLQSTRIIAPPAGGKKPSNKQN